MRRQLFPLYLVLAFWLGYAPCAVSAPLPFLRGADLSMLPAEEASGVVFTDHGKPIDVLKLLRRNGGNCVRLRLFVQPNGVGGVINDLPYTLAFARRVKANKLLLLLDLHYSDTWADPGHQSRPAAWEKLSFPDLVTQTETYTADVIRAFREVGALPDIVQVGNEITNGMLWPGAKFQNATEPQAVIFDRLSLLLRAGVRGVRTGAGSPHAVRIMVHTDTGGKLEVTRWFFSNITQRHVPFDLIGLSYYPWWHGAYPYLAANLHQTARLFHKPIVVVETQYPAAPSAQEKGKKNMAWPLTPDGQASFVRAVVEAVQCTPGHLGCGVVYWNPESNATPAAAGTWRGSLSLFDSLGNARPAWHSLNR